MRNVVQRLAIIMMFLLIYSAVTHAAPNARFVICDTRWSLNGDGVGAFFFSLGNSNEIAMQLSKMQSHVQLMNEAKCNSESGKINSMYIANCKHTCHIAADLVELWAHYVRWDCNTICRLSAAEGKTWNQIESPQFELFIDWFDLP